MLRYALASQVFACLDGDQVVLLDLKQDRYFSFEAAKARGLHSLVAGWPAVPAAGDSDTGSPLDGDRIARQLLERNILTRNNGTARNETAPIVAAHSEMICDRYDDVPSRSLRGIISFVAATTIATVMLRFGSLERAVRRVKERRARRPHSASFDVERTRDLLAIFTHLRPFLFTSRDQCLFESLVLIEFLARYGIFPSWVFGVQSRPFAAHCWVQEGDRVLNDTLDHLGRYTRIMAV